MVAVARPISGKAASVGGLFHRNEKTADRGGKMLTCDLSPPGKARGICASRGEFDAFTAQYME
jgi:hypothetical protein